MAQSNLFHHICSEMNNGAHVGEKNIETLHVDNITNARKPNFQGKLSFNNYGKNARKETHKSVRMYQTLIHQRDLRFTM